MDLIREYANRPPLSKRRRMLRGAVPTLLLSGAVAALAWLLADAAFGPDAALFAPVAAVWTLGLGMEGSALRAVGVGVGVAIGLVVGGVLIDLVGDGAWQLGLIVILARGAAILTDGSILAANQATITAVLVVALHDEDVFPGERLLDALLGAALALIAVAILRRLPWELRWD